MAQPDFLSAGATPSPIDTKLRIWVKILGQYQNNIGGGLAANNPRPTDTLRVIKEKWNAALNGTAYGT